MVKLTVALPTHGMEDRQYFFKRCLNSLWSQTFQDFEIVVTDNSDDNIIEDICKHYSTGIRYFRNPRKGMAQNTNEAIKQSKGELIKILYMDDFLNYNGALQGIVDHFKGYWLVTDCIHYDETKYFNHHKPHYNEQVYMGNNTIGSPSVLTIKNDEPMLFDENLTWLLDCDLYKRYYERYGNPTILNDKNVVIGVGQHQATNILLDEVKLKEYSYMQQKYVTA